MGPAKLGAFTPGGSMKRLLLLLALAAALPAHAQETIKIGLVTALSGQSARAGEAITRGLQVAIDEINARGGVLNPKNCGMILVNNPWGESNEKGLTAALAAKGMRPAGIEKFEGNDVDVVPQLSRLKAAGADCLFLVGNVGPSAQVVKSLDRMGWKPPIVSHWGPAGGRFTELAGPSAPSVHFVQNHSVFRKKNPAGGTVLDERTAAYP